MTRLAGTRRRDVALSLAENIGTIQKRQPEHDQRTDIVSDSWKAHQSNKERFEVCWQQGSNMTGQALQQKIHGHFRREEPMSIRAIQGQFKVTQVNFRRNGFLTQKVEQGYAPFLYHVKQLTSGGSSPDASCTLFQVRKRLGTSKSIQMTQKETWMNWQNKLWMRVPCKKNTFNLESMQKLPTRRVEARCTSAPVIHL